MPYRIRKSPHAARPYQIVNIQTGKVVGSSVSKNIAQRSIDHRISGEAKSVKTYKKKIDNKMHSFGETDLEKKVIRINKSKKKNTRGDILDTIVHEVKHVKHPNKHEKTIRKDTAIAIKRMTKKQKQKHYNLFNG